MTKSDFVKSGFAKSDFVKSDFAKATVAVRKKIPKCDSRLILLVFRLFLCGDLIKQKHYADNYCHYNNNAQHTNAHVFQIFHEHFRMYLQERSENIAGHKQINHIHKIHHHNFLLSLHEKVQYQTACNNGCDLTGYVYADRVHEKEVLRIFFKSHFMNDTS